MVYLCSSLAVSTGLTVAGRLAAPAAPPRLRRALGRPPGGLRAAPVHHDAAAPVVVQELGHDPDRAASVLDLPADHMQTFARAMFHQTIHGKPLVGGFIARYLKGQLETSRSTLVMSSCTPRRRAPKRPVMTYRASATRPDPLDPVAAGRST